jgi:5-methylcytosine-specific restriction enzyme A
MATTIPDDLIREANGVSREVRPAVRKEAVRMLGEKYGVPVQTTQAHVGWYIWLRTGKRIRQTVSASAARIILEAVAEDGAATLLTALETLWEHIVYRGQAQVEMRALHAEFMTRLPSTVDIDRSSHELLLSVEASLRDTDEARAARLSLAPRTPEKMIVMTRVFRRNADVIATVLLRANGICEGCRHPAPFKRADGRPYLEVHHKKRLADGGDDTVDNAYALCPNCHRERHFGSAFADEINR